MTVQNIMSVFPSKYLRAADFEQPELLTMTQVKMEQMQDGKAKPVLYFEEHTSGIVLNKTRAKVITKQYGVNPQEWTGKKIVAYSGTAEFGGLEVEAIAFRAPKKNGAAKATQVTSENPADGFDDEVPF